MTNEYYDKLLEMYREKYLQQENFNTCVSSYILPYTVFNNI